MALTEKYSSAAGAGAHDGTSEANAWSFVEAAANAVAGNRVNHKGVVTLGASWTPTNSGTATSPLIFRGYGSSIGDGYQGHTNGNGALITTNMPLLTLGAYQLDMNANSYMIFESFRTIGSANKTIRMPATGILVRNQIVQTADSVNAVGSDQLNSIIFDNDISAPAGGAITYGYGVNLTNNNGRVIGNRFNCSAAAVTLNNTTYHIVDDNTFRNGIWCINCGPFTGSLTAKNNTGYNMYVLIEWGNNPTVTMPCLSNNHFTDTQNTIYSRFTNSLYTTTGLPIFRGYNRTRDVTNADVGWGDWPEYGAVTTDTGGAATDYVNAGSADFNLIAGAPGRAAGLPAYRSVGALEPQATTPVSKGFPF